MSINRITFLFLVYFASCNFLLYAAPIEQNIEEAIDAIISSIDRQEYTAADRLLENELLHARKNDSLYNYLELIKTVGTAYRKKQHYQKAIPLFQLALPESLWRTLDTSRERSKAVWTYVQLAFTYEKFGDYLNAKKVYRFALELANKNEENNYQIAKYIQKPLANIYTRLGEFEAGETVLKEFIQIVETQEDFTQASKGYNDLGLLYASWSKPESAQKAYQSGLALPTISRSENALILLNMSDLLIQMQELESVEGFIDQAMLLMQKEAKEEVPHEDLHFFIANIFSKKAYIATELQDYDNALDALDKEFHHYQIYYHNTQRREFGKVYVQKGFLFLEIKDHPQALAQFQLALQSVLYNYEPTGPHDLPSPTACYAENTIMEALSGMAEVYQQWYKTEPNAFYLEQALASYELMHVVEQALRQSYLYDSSKLFNLEESRQQSENAIRVAHQLYQQNQDKNLLYQAFVFAERNRSSLLRAAFRTNNAAIQAGLSEEELAEEGALQRTVSQAEEELFRLRSEEASTDTLIRTAEQDLLAAQDAMRNWLQALEERNPRYYQLKYADEVPTLAELQSMLGRHEQLIEYFVGEGKIYVFQIDGRGLSLHQIPKPAQLTARILAWRAAIENYQLPGNDRSQLSSHYQQEAYLLYQELVAPIITDASGKSLLLVTSGLLDLLPFEALLTREVAAGTSFNDYPYLLRDFPISYTYAASLQWSLYQLERHQGEKGGFAPTFTGQSGWPALSCSSDLLKTTVDNPANLYLSGDATIKQLQNQASRFRLLHLATHAQANAEEGDFSFIVFSDGQGGYDSLFAKDLYLYELETELVILSACETALGTLYNSEGVISLARAFHYAGARSVMNTLWRINENANCNLLEGFYTALDDGQDKRSALQNAKLAYLKNADPRSAHPVYWAGFQLLGNPRPLEARAPWYLWVIGGLVVVSLTALLLLGRRRRLPNA
jgi:hypothetical protein